MSSRNFSTGSLTELDLRCIIPLKKRNDPEATTAEKITSLGSATIRRKWPEKIKKLSDKRLGITLGDALEIAAGIKD